MVFVKFIIKSRWYFAFLGVLFLLNIVYSYLGPISKIVLGFLISIVIYLIALYLNNKSYILESKLLFGTSLAINYLVILAGRYLIEISSINTDYVFNETITFYLLVLNTIFFVFTSILYKFDDLLIGSFFISYCVPFLIGASNNSPYSLIFL